MGKINFLKINAKKTKAVHLKRKHNMFPPFFLCNAVEDYIDQFKSLRVIFSASMSWKNHLHHIRSNLAKVVGIMGIRKYCLPINNKMML